MHSNFDFEASLLPTNASERVANTESAANEEGTVNAEHLRVPEEVLMFLHSALGREPVGAGVPDGFMDALERVPKKQLRAGMICPICGNEFLEDPYPLVVRLACHR